MTTTYLPLDVLTGERLERRRLYLGYSVDVIATVCGCAEEVVERIERGERRDGDENVVRLMVEFLGA